MSGGSRRRSPEEILEHRALILAAIALLAIATGGLLHLVGEGGAGNDVWRAAVALLALELAFEVGHTVLVERHLGVDTIALVAMVGSLALGQELAGVVVGLMFSGGAALEDVASTRARRELTALVQRAPKVAQRLRGRRASRRCPSSEVRAGDVVVVRTGEVVPVDGTLVSGRGGARHEHAERRAAAGRPYPPGCRCSAAPQTRARRSRCGRTGRRRRARTRRSCGSSSRHRRSARRSCAWPTATRGSSCRRRCSRRAQRGPSAGIRSERSRSWWSRRPAR